MNATTEHFLGFINVRSCCFVLFIPAYRISLNIDRGFYLSHQQGASGLKVYDEALVDNHSELVDHCWQIDDITLLLKQNKEKYSKEDGGCIEYSIYKNYTYRKSQESWP